MLLADLWAYLEAEIFTLSGAPGLFAPYGRTAPEFDCPDGALRRRENLRAYLASLVRRPRFLLLGEAVHPGADRFSGVPLTSEAQLSEGRLPFCGRPSSRGGVARVNVQASLFWDELLPFHGKFGLWNVLPFLPHYPDQPLAFRPPETGEIEAYGGKLRGVIKILAPESVVALGRGAAQALQLLEIPHHVLSLPAGERNDHFQRAVTEIFWQRPGRAAATAVVAPVKQVVPAFPAAAQAAGAGSPQPAAGGPAADRSSVQDYLEKRDWRLAYTHVVPSRPAAFEATDGLNLGRSGRRLLETVPGLYRHQKLAVQAQLEGRNVCLATSTASGKTLAFHLAALELLERDEGATVLALYPLKALAAEQEDRWREALKSVGRGEETVGRIDGSVRNPHRRLAILQSARVLLMTPDVAHAWLLAHLRDPQVRAFLQRLRLVILDEAHTYSGVFGSNCAYLFRRLGHAVRGLAGAAPRFFAASATVASPARHLAELTGEPFTVIGPEAESSPRHELTVLMLTPPEATPPLFAVTDLLRFLARRTAHRFIGFVDSRKKTEYLAALATQRERGRDQAEETTLWSDLLTQKAPGGGILPYRAGYEDKDRQHIQRRLTAGGLAGVVSTSALEMGLDIPHLTLGVLYGVPRGATSFWQRVGRIGRRQAGLVLIVNDGSVHSEAVFRRPQELLRMPLAETSLYLENPRIQYAHALCFGRRGGEADALAEIRGEREWRAEIRSEAPFPPDFYALCAAERRGEVPPALAAIREQGGETPNYELPLREIEDQYRVFVRRPGGLKRLGTLSHTQVLREAYPGAVYYHAGKPYRVCKLDPRRRRLVVRPEKKYLTVPLILPGILTPGPAEVPPREWAAGALRVRESALAVCEMVHGYQERRGQRRETVEYPLESGEVEWPKRHFSRSLDTTGVLLMHPALAREDVCPQLLAELLLEAFFETLPLARQDLGCGTDRIRDEIVGWAAGTRYLAVYDQTCGSLHLSGRLGEPELLRSVLDRALELAGSDPRFAPQTESVEALRQMRECLAPSEAALVQTVGAGVR